MSGPVSVTLVALVAVYLGMPLRDHERYFDEDGQQIADPELLDLPANLLRNTEARIRAGIKNGSLVGIAEVTAHP